MQALDSPSLATTSREPGRCCGQWSGCDRMLVDGELRSVIETLPEGLLLFDDQRGFYEANRAARDLRLEETIPQLEETASRALIAHGSQEQSFRLGAAAPMPIRGTVLRLSGRRAAMLLRRETVRQAEL